MQALGSGDDGGIETAFRDLVLTSALITLAVGADASLLQDVAVVDCLKAIQERV